MTHVVVAPRGAPLREPGTPHGVFDGDRRLGVRRAANLVGARALATDLAARLERGESSSSFG